MIFGSPSPTDRPDASLVSTDIDRGHSLGLHWYDKYTELSQARRIKLSVLGESAGNVLGQTRIRPAASCSPTRAVRPVEYGLPQKASNLVSHDIICITCEADFSIKDL